MGDLAIFTRRALLGVTAALGAVGIPASALSEEGSTAANPHAELLDLIRRHGEADQALRLAEDEAERQLRVARAAYPERPEALLHRPGDFPRTSLRFSLSRHPGEGGERVYGEHAADWLRDRPASTWYRTLSPPLGPECETRRIEILAAFDTWTAEMAAVDDRVGWTAADEARAALGRAFWTLDDAIRAHQVRTLPELRSKAAWIAERSGGGLDETDNLIAFAHEVAAFGGVTS